MRGVFSHTTPLAAFRRIGRLEANYLTESLIEATARETGIDRIELRRRNMITPGEFPWTTPGGAVLTAGAFKENLRFESVVWKLGYWSISDPRTRPSLRPPGCPSRWP